MGLFFVSKNIFEIYLPRIPMPKSCIPPKNSIIVTIEAQPTAGSPCIKYLIIINIIAIVEKTQEITPKKLAIFRGVSEKIYYSIY